MTKSLFEPFQMGDLELSNRLVMAPMTRNRAAEGNTPTALTAEYYAQRAGAGLIITEATQVSAAAVGYPATPGLHNDTQIKAWKSVTDAVHQRGGKIFVQIWYCGRVSHPSLLPEERTPVAPSAIKPEGEAITYTGMQPYVTPKALTKDEIATIVDQFRQTAENSKQAGFDGIEIHAANGYLIDQFLRDGSNQRDDEYGGSAENRMRFLNQILDAVLEVLPASRVGIRLSPENSFNSMSDSDPANHFSYFVQQLNHRKLAYLHVLQGDMMTQQSAVDYVALRHQYQGVYMANNGYDKARAEQSLANGDADLIAMGVPFLANPDLVERLKSNAELNTADQPTFYGGGEAGYTDYPTLAEQAAVPA